MAPGVSRHSTCATGGQQSKAAFARQQAGPYNSAVRDWDLTSGDPLSLCIAADARLCQPNYSDDQTWELRLEGGEPTSLAIETTYGLRARGMRIFPAFQIGEQYRLDPATFADPPRVRRFLPNFLREIGRASCRERV